MALFAQLGAAGNGCQWWGELTPTSHATVDATSARKWRSDRASDRSTSGS